MNGTFIRFLYLLCFLYGTPLALAQDKSDFFEKGFSQHILEEKGALVVEQNRPLDTSSPKILDTPETGQALKTLAPNPSITAQAEDFVSGDGPRIITLGLVISSEPTKHLDGGLRAYNRVFSKFPLLATGDIQIVGEGTPSVEVQQAISSALEIPDRERRFGALLSSLPLMPEGSPSFEDLPEDSPLFKQMTFAVQQLLERDPVIHKYVELYQHISFIREIPQDLGVKHSPAWIIKTDDKEIVLEGFLKPERFISKEGRFIAPTEEEAITPLPQPVQHQ